MLAYHHIAPCSLDYMFFLVFARESTSLIVWLYQPLQSPSMQDMGHVFTPSYASIFDSIRLFK